MLRMLAMVLAGALWLAPAGAAAQAFADWVRPTAPVRPVGGSGVRGEVGLVPTGDGDYELCASVVPANRRLAWAVASGPCAAWTAASVATLPVFVEEAPSVAGNSQLFSRPVQPPRSPDRIRPPASTGT